MAPIDPVRFEGDAISQAESTASAANISRDYYDFSEYVSKTRMLTFWHQLDEVLASAPSSVLEIGVGPAVVSGTLRALDINLTTVDINAELRPDHVGSVVQLDEVIESKSVDTILCARVLHHLSFSEFDTSLEQLAKAARSCVVLTLPVDEARLYLGLRRTAKPYRITSLRLPAAIKKVGMSLLSAGENRYQQLWKIDSHPETAEAVVVASIEKHFKITKQFRVPEDQSHAFFVLSPL